MLERRERTKYRGLISRLLMLLNLLMSLISRHPRVNLPRPAFDASGHGLRLLVALLAQPVGHRERTHPVMTVDDDVLLGVELLHAGRNVSHGDVLAVRNACGLALPGL